MSATAAATPNAAAIPNASTAPSNAQAQGALLMPSVSLYVGDLHADVTEPMLFEIFHQVGPVASIRVCRDAITRRSLGYAYVNFQNMVDAERALDTLNYTTIKDRPCRIMWKHRDPSVRKAGLGNIFIKGLEKDIDTRVLFDTFSQFGNIVSCKVATTRDNVSLGHGYVQYQTKEEADSAIAKVNGKLINGKKVTVCTFLPKSSRTDTAENHFTNVYVKNLSESVDDKMLADEFAKIGPTTSVVVMKDEAGKSKGFGFVNFETHEAAQKAVTELSGTTFHGKELYCGRAEKKERRDAQNKAKYMQRRAEQQAKFQGVNLYVKNLDESVDDEKLRAEFAPFGTLQSAKVMTTDNGISKGFGFVCFSTPEDATRAITAMNGQLFNSKPLYVALHQTKEVRRAQLQMQAQFTQRQSQLGAPAQMGMQARPGGPMPPMMFPQMAPFMPYQQVPMAGGRWPVQMQGQRMQMSRGGGSQRYRQRQQPVAQANQAGSQISGGAGVQIKYTSNARNQQVHQSAVPASAMSTPEAASTALANAPPEQQKQILGERLYQLISDGPAAANAPKITGMLLELDNSELINLIESPQELAVKVQEAIDALSQATA
eukprot:JP435679.1.p1 GENE.JP435679.1~~JP435679.1.p1  ORF type:complete len:623 (+),score=168.69 JP435679.1:67-1869(+)